MSFLRKDFLYMPQGSYFINPDGSVSFLKELPNEIKEKFLKELEEKKKKPIDPHSFV